MSKQSYSEFAFMYRPLLRRTVFIFYFVLIQFMALISSLLHLFFFNICTIYFISYLLLFSINFDHREGYERHSS